MSGKYTWKLIVTAVVLGWAVLNLMPLRTTPFADYVRREGAGGPEFEAVLAKAQSRVDAQTAPSFYAALKQVAEEDSIDLAKFFPDIPVEKSINVRKRNGLLLQELLRQSRSSLRPGLDLAGGVSFMLEVDRPPGSEKAENERSQELQKAIDIIGERVDAFGVSEPIIRPVGDNRIEVQLAGISTRENPDVVDVLKKPARLEFRLVDPLHRPDPSRPDWVPDPAYEKMTLEMERGNELVTQDLFVKRIPEMTGDSVADAYVYSDQYGNPQVGLRFTNEGADRFAEITGQMQEQNQRLGLSRGNYSQLAIVLDGKLYSAPEVREQIRGGNAVITGHFSATEAYELANVLNNPLDVPLRIVSMSEVGPSLAQDSITSGRNAFIIGTILTALFMMIFYTTAGLLAVIAMTLNVIIILGVMASDFVGATLSMPGIAGIVLTLGMSVDSNILIFERVREELATGKSLRAALEAGHERAFSAIFDANITTLITAVIMIVLGTGPVKGFGVTLTIGIFSTMFAALVVTRVLLEVLVFPGLLKRVKFFSFPIPQNIDYLKYARPAFIFSWLIVLTGVCVVAVKGRSIYGVDFTGGDVVTLTYEHRLEDGQIRAAAAQIGIEDVTPVYERLLGTDQEVVKIQTPFDQGKVLVDKLLERFPEAGLKQVGEDRIGASVSTQIQWNAIIAIGLSILGILLYVAFRFEIGYGAGAVVSTIHDVLMTVGIFVMFGRQFDAAMVGAILLIVGYSINDTIVVFDRIREELHLNPTMRLRDVINHSLNRTMLRTVNTGGTTLLTAISLFVFATGAVNDIAFTLIIGIITGTFSSVFIASPIFFWWHKGDRRHVEASHDIAPKYEWSASSRASQ